MDDVGVVLLHEVAGKESAEGNDAADRKVDALASAENNKALGTGTTQVAALDAQANRDNLALVANILMFGGAAVGVAGGALLGASLIGGE